MSIKSQIKADNTAEMAIEGEFDKKNVLLFRDTIMNLISEDIKLIYVDLSKMDYIDGMGIGVFLSASFSVSKEFGEIIFKNPQMQINDLLESTQVLKHLNFHGE